MLLLSFLLLFLLLLLLLLFDQTRGNQGRKDGDRIDTASVGNAVRLPCNIIERPSYPPWSFGRHQPCPYCAVACACLPHIQAEANKVLPWPTCHCSSHLQPGTTIWTAAAGRNFASAPHPTCLPEPKPRREPFPWQHLPLLIVPGTSLPRRRDWQAGTRG